MKNNCLNVWKGIAAFFVVFIHCSFPSPVGGMMNGLARWAVPMFFLISGYFSYGKGADTVKRRICRTFGLFVLANGIYFLWKLVTLWSEGILTVPVVQSWFAAEPLFKWLVWNQSPFMGHLWFLGALLYCYLFYALLVRKGWEERFYLLIPLCLAGNLLLGVVLPVLGQETSFLHVRNFWLTGLPFFLWGHWFARQEGQGKLRIRAGYCLAGIAAGAGLSMVEMLLSGGAELYLGSILIAAGLFLLALRHPDWGKESLLERIGARDSLHIYLWQMILIDLTQAVAYTCGFREHMVYQWLMPIWICLISWLFAEGIQKGLQNRIIPKKG